MSGEESASGASNQPAAAAPQSKLAGIFAGRKRQVRTALIVLGGLVIIVVIIPRVFHAFRTAVNSYLAQVQPNYLQQTGDPVAAKQMALQSLDNLRQQQASALAYFDTFLVFAVLAVALTFLVLLMKRSVAERGAHVAAE